MTNESVDVVIVGAGASGAAIAWSLVDTKMKILCLEQGDWVNPADYPTTGTDWEAKGWGDFSFSPNTRGRETDYPINEDDSPINIANFNPHSITFVITVVVSIACTIIIIGLLVINLQIKYNYFYLLVSINCYY